MERKPFGRHGTLVNREMWRNIIVMSLYQLIVCLVLLFAGEDLLDLRGTGDHHYIVLG